MVVDLAHELGVALSPHQVVRVNESLTLEAVALLFVQRKWGEGFVRGFRGAPRMNADFAAALAGIGDSKFAFSHDLVSPWIEEHRADVKWIEQRLGLAVLDAPKASSRPVSSEEDLLAIALENANALESLVGEHASEAVDARDRLVENLEILRRRHSTPRPLSNPAPRARGDRRPRSRGPTDRRPAAPTAGSDEPGRA